MTKNKLLNLHRIIIASATLAHLAFTTFHNAALVLLFNQYCGFIMFMFVLTGLMCLFNAARINDTDNKSVIVSIVSIAISGSFGGFLAYLYITGSSESLASNIDVGPIYLALVVTIIVLAAYVSGIVFLVLSKLSKNDNVLAPKAQKEVKLKK